MEEIGFIFFAFHIRLRRRRRRRSRRNKIAIFHLYIESSVWLCAVMAGEEI
jgi:hypothetical protein